tara:strand:+ start:163 stop:348 length:186 start_codon:yes stop_codon:yes gene_type:complete
MKQSGIGGTGLVQCLPKNYVRSIFILQTIIQISDGTWTGFLSRSMAKHIIYGKQLIMGAKF